MSNIAYSDTKGDLPSCVHLCVIWLLKQLEGKYSVASGRQSVSVCVSLTNANAQLIDALSGNVSVQ